MIIHDCLNIFIKNLTVILISSLYLTKFIISTFAKKCVIRPNLHEKWAHIRKSKYQFIHDIRLATWWCMVLFNFQHFKIDGFHSVHGPFSMTLTKSFWKDESKRKEEFRWWGNVNEKSAFSTQKKKLLRKEGKNSQESRTQILSLIHDKSLFFCLS